MQLNHVIIQAGGKGTRLKDLTRNKPKCIVPVNNKPIIFNMFDKYPEKKFIVIGDYLFDVLKKYIEAFANVKVIPLKAKGAGTCGGIGQSLELIPHGAPFMLIWSDLILSDSFNIDFNVSENLVGISKGFECRWRYENGIFSENPSTDQGVAGMFVFANKGVLDGVPESGEFVHWLSKSSITFSELGLQDTREVGTLKAYNETENKEYRCRPFNEMIFESDKVIKRSLDNQGDELALREVAWYKEAELLGFSNIPKIHKYSPLVMSRINGYNIFKGDYSNKEKVKLVDNLVKTISSLHQLKSVPEDKFSIIEAYYTKTMSRLSKVRDLIPFADKQHIQINGKQCRNVFFYKERLYDNIINTLLDSEFAFIHGDCTFSNIMTDDSLNITLLDPRGYFGYTELYGDVLYDWSKLYYSLYGNYDQFNNKNFSLNISEKDITLNIESNGFEDLSEYFLDNLPGNEYKIRLVHAIIWLSLTTYAWEDYDSVCGAFYNGLYHLEDLI